MQTIVCLGRCYQALGKLEAALEHYDSALRADGSKAYAFFCRGHCRRLLGDAAGASSDFAQVLKSDAAFPVPYLRRAEAAMARGDGAAAREMLEALANALPLGPDDEYRVREMQDRLRMDVRNAPGHSAGGGPLTPARSGLGSR